VNRLILGRQEPPVVTPTTPLPPPTTPLSPRSSANGRASGRTITSARTSSWVAIDKASRGRLRFIDFKIPIAGAQAGATIGAAGRRMIERRRWQQNRGNSTATASQQKMKCDRTATRYRS
jgi:hypothetical protein